MITHIRFVNYDSVNVSCVNYEYFWSDSMSFMALYLLLRIVQFLSRSRNARLVKELSTANYFIFTSLWLFRTDCSFAPAVIKSRVVTNTFLTVDGKFYACDFLATYKNSQGTSCPRELSRDLFSTGVNEILWFLRFLEHILESFQYLFMKYIW